MKFGLVVILVLFSLLFNSSVFASLKNVEELRKSGIIDAQIGKLPTGEFPEPVEVSFGPNFVSIIEQSVTPADYSCVEIV